MAANELDSANRMSRLFPEKPESRLRIYAWSPNDPPAGYAGLLKVGQTTKADVNARIRESHRQPFIEDRDDIWNPRLTWKTGIGKHDSSYCYDTIYR